MLRALFLSDLHISSRNDPKYRSLVALLKSCLEPDRAPSHVFFLGDIFDLWVGAHSWLIQEYSEVIDIVQALRSRGVRVIYFEGNHDLYLDRFWGERLGLQIHHEAAYVVLGPWTVRLEHGDQMNPNDTGYLWLRWFLRTGLMRFVQAVLPNQAVRALGEWMSEKSRNQTGRDAKVAAPILSIIRRHATKAHGERAFDFLIAGHVHVQDWYELKVQGNRGPHVPVAINLGTWLDAPVVLELTDSGAQWIKEHSAFGNSHR